MLPWEKTEVEDDASDRRMGRQTMSAHAGRLLARFFLGLLEDNEPQDILARPQSRRARILTRRYLALEWTDATPKDLLQDAWECFEANCNESLSKQVDCDPLERICDEVTTALGMKPPEASLLRLSAHVHRTQDLASALDLVGECEDHEAASLFAPMLGLDWDDVLTVLHTPSPFRALGIHDVMARRHTPTRFLAFPGQVSRVMQRYSASAGDVLACFFRLSPEPRLTMADFASAGQDVEFLQRYLRLASAQERRGVNILLHGKPGTGKTELARALARDLGLVLQEVPSVDDDKDPLPPFRRLSAYCAAQDIMAPRPGTALLFDEVEDVFPWAQEGDTFSMRRRGRGNSDRNKGWLTGVLESNPRPAIWVCNHIDQMDPAYLRRFDMVIELRGPDREARQRLVAKLFDGIAVGRSDLAHLSNGSGLAVGHLERMAGVLRVMAPVNEQEGSRMLGALTQQLQDALGLPADKPRLDALLPYRADCVNTDCDLVEVADALSASPSARLCLYGPPGTGKTEWARELAQRLSRQLLVRRASDLLDKYVGGTEARIRAAFEQAQAEGAILLIDEADSFLQARDGAKAHWETSMVNEMLTAMESFDGIFVASTNLQDRLDAASARRFDFKVKFSPLDATQARQLFGDLLDRIGVPKEETPPAISFDALAGATPGDFANVARQVRLAPSKRNPRSVFQLLKKELEFRQAPLGSGRRIGFV